MRDHNVSKSSFGDSSFGDTWYPDPFVLIRLLTLLNTVGIQAKQLARMNWNIYMKYVKLALRTPSIKYRRSVHIFAKSDVT